MSASDSDDSIQSPSYIPREERMQILQLNEDIAENSSFRPFVIQNQDQAPMQRQPSHELIEYPCHILYFRKADIKKTAKFWVHILNATREQTDDTPANQAIYNLLRDKLSLEEPEDIISECRK